MRWITVGTVFCLACVFSFGQERKDAPVQEKEDLLVELFKMAAEQEFIREKTSFINLINGLNLSKEQMSEILKVNEEFRAEVERRYDELKEKFKQAKECFERWIEIIKKGELPEKEMKETQMADSEMVKIGHWVQSLQQKYGEHLDKVFTDAQRAVIDDFNPCIVPPQNLRDPIRVGQASGANPELINGLRFIRSLNGKPFQQRIVIESAVQRAVKFETELAHLTEEEQKVEAERIRKLIEKACDMSDVDFELNKDKLAEEFISGSAYEKLKKLQKEMEKIGSEIQKIGKERRLRNADRVVKYFLNPVIVEPILKERLGSFEEKKSSGAEKAGQNR
ncbi:MAG: hypothetical protein N2234_04280 [Planctomycetota bacterium]|nr:hypothetical protein [Planctomycetota bacterium]